MADQSNLSIGTAGNPVGADPSGTHPIGSLNANWTESIDDDALRFTANTIMSDVDSGTYHTDTTADYYSEELCVGPLMEGIRLEIGDTGNAQVFACWQYYDPTGESFNGSSEVVPGTAASQSGGTWTDIGTAAQDYAQAPLHSAYAADVAALDKGAKLRVKMVVTDAGGGSGGDGVSHTIINAGVAAVNASFCTIPIDMKASNNLSMVSQYSGQTIDSAGGIGGIGADPS